MKEEATIDKLPELLQGATRLIVSRIQQVEECLTDRISNIQDELNLMKEDLQKVKSAVERIEREI